MNALFRRDALFLIAGPCQLEDDALNLRVGEHLARLAERVPGGIIYKASFDKANRSNVGATRGPGLEQGLAALDRVRRATGLPVLTDVHLPEQCAAAGEVVDVLQIPAFLCRQTDLLVAAGRTGRPVNVKKGQWMHPEGMRGALEKVRAGFADAGTTGTAEVAAASRACGLPAMPR
jgi:2-dehydro-3-deoxyphosphooctonate aldolase (KDO 8-P synthase)